MATGQTASSYQTVLGIAPEPQPPTGVPVPATKFIPIKKLDADNKPVKLPDQSWRGSMVQTVGMQNGPMSSEVSIGGDAFADTIGFPIVGMLGDLVTTGSAAPYTHTVGLQNGGNGQPQSYSITDSDPLSTRLYASSRFSELTLSWDASELLTWDATVLAWVGALGAKPTQAYSTIPPSPSWQASATLGGVAVPNLKTAELSFSRDGSECIFSLQNDQNPYEVHVGPIDLEVNLTWIASNEAPLIALLANTIQPLVLNMTSGTGAALTQLQVTMSAFNYTEATKSKGNSWIEFETTGIAIGNTTDAGASGGYSPCQIKMQNAIAANVYVPTP